MQHDTFIIEGGRELGGEISVNGAKNAALKIMAAALLSSEPCTVTNLPDIEDVQRMRELLTSLGVNTASTSDGLTIQARDIISTTLDRQLVERIRSSILLAGPLLARCGEVVTPHPGGCNIGQRPIDLFLDGFRALGVTVEERPNHYRLTTRHLSGGTIILRRTSVTVTEEMVMTAVLADGTTVIKNAAMEPEIIALANYLNAHGAIIDGAGTPTIIIRGVPRLGAGEYRLIPDRIEAGTFVMLGLLTNSELRITNCEPQHLENLWVTLARTGAALNIGRDYVATKKHRGLKGVNIVTHEYPGFATDLQPPYTVLMTQAHGQTLIHETIHEGRLFYTDQLRAMGANIIMCDPHRVVVNGPTELRGRYLTSPDLRAGMALILAALAAAGTTTIDNIYQVERGYAQVAERLQTTGASIRRAPKA